MIKPHRCENWALQRYSCKQHTASREAEGAAIGVEGRHALGTCSRLLAQAAVLCCRNSLICEDRFGSLWHSWHPHHSYGPQERMAS